MASTRSKSKVFLVIIAALVALALIVAAIVVGVQSTSTGSGGGAGAGGFTPEDEALIAQPAHHGQGEAFYFVLTDRFANGDESNDDGGLGSDPMVSGFDPSNKGFYNGGDIAGLHSKLDYLQNLGITAIWLTPSFKNQPVQGEGENASAGYHGYWTTDFTQIDPHLGTNEELKALISDAHARDMKVYFDIIVNHTADLIQYPETEGSAPAYRPLNQDPYTPERTGDVVPSELNDVTLYHNRGNGTWQNGHESFIYGDFSGLDDLKTEDPRVLDIMTDLYTAWADFGVDGYRIDTMKHVDFPFWQQWSERIDEHNASANPDFFMFGEVINTDPQELATYPRESGIDATLDFGFQDAAVKFLNGGPASGLSQFFARDDYYTTDHSSAGDQPTFLGNHDMGRIGKFLTSADKKLELTELGYQLMFLTRGQPVVYYGDEQGFIGIDKGMGGTDKDARQSLFATQVTDYAQQPLLTGEEAGSVDRYDENAPVYQAISEVAKLRESTPALRTGAQIELHADPNAGIYAFARVDSDEKTEYLVAVNNSSEEKSASFATLTPGATYEPLLGASESVKTEDQISLTVPAYSAVVYKADTTVAAAEELSVTLSAGRDGVVSGTPHALEAQPEATIKLTEISATVPQDRWSQTSFWWREAGSDGDWNWLGTATGDMPRVFHDLTGLDVGTKLEYRAVTIDAADNKAAASAEATVGE